GNWGSLASIVGLLFSALAFLFSRRASEAAARARQAILRRSLGDDLNGATRGAAELVTYVSIERTEIALLRTGDLLNQTGYLIKRWSDNLSEHSMNDLLNVRAQLESIHRVLTGGPIIDLSAKQRVRLLQACQRVSTILSEQHGAATRSADQEDQT
ncbi:MAG TPA: hypothetical protein VMJ75_01090, partial [Candidatus Acidoferrales bacterium]|nr:hypothetical protein [Candidatus Acidoferrales bacterium]